MAAKGKFFVPQHAATKFQQIYLSNLKDLRFTDLLGTLITLCEFAEHRKDSTSRRTGNKLEIWRVYPECLDEINNEIPLHILEELDETFVSEKGMRLIVDPAPPEGMDPKFAKPVIINIMSNNFGEEAE